MKPIVIFLISWILFSQDTNMTLDDLKWEYRVVLYFPVEGQSPLILNDSIQHEIEERKIAYFIYGDSVITNLDTSFSPAYLQQVESKYKMGYSDNVYVLIGLDGGVKMRKEEPLDWENIFRTIDSMPMRQSEIRGGINK